MERVLDRHVLPIILFVFFFLLFLKSCLFGSILRSVEIIKIKNLDRRGFLVKIVVRFKIFISLDTDFTSLTVN